MRNIVEAESKGNNSFMLGYVREEGGRIETTLLFQTEEQIDGAIDHFKETGAIPGIGGISDLKVHGVTKLKMESPLYYDMGWNKI